MKYKKSAILSCLLHFILFASALIGFHGAQTKAGNPKIIQTYLYQNNMASRASLSANRLQPIDQHLTLKAANGTLPHQSKVNPVNQKNNRLSLDIQKSNGTASPLLEILHNRIAENLDYSNDTEMERMAIVGFLLFPDGHLDAIQLLKSSQDSLLDEAIMSSVKTIQPVSEAKKYLQTESYFKLSILLSNDPQK